MRKKIFLCVFAVLILALCIGTKEDFTALCKILQDDDVMYAYEGKFNDKEVTEWLDRQLWRYENENGHGLYAVILKENGELIGQCGLTLQDYKEKNRVFVSKKYWHKGYATEAAKAWKRYAFEVLGEKEIKNRKYPFKLKNEAERVFSVKSFRIEQVNRRQ